MARVVDGPEGELQSAASAKSIPDTLTSPTATDSRHVSLLLDDKIGEDHRASEAENDDVVDVGGEDESVEEGHGWFVNFVVTRITIPRLLWKSLMLPDGQIPEPDMQARKKSILGLPILPVYHPAAVTWMAFMLLFDLVYTAFGLPLTLAFCIDHDKPDLSLSNGCTQINFFAGLIYTLNLAFSFHIGAILSHDYEEYDVNTDGKLLATCYVKHGRFTIDLLGSIPFVTLVIILGLETQSVQVSVIILTLSLLRLFRLVRLLSLSKIVYMNAIGHGGLPIGVASSYIILLAYMLAVVLNLETCIMLLVATLEGHENSWLVSLAWMDFVDAPSIEQWFCSLYWIVTTATTTGYGDVVPHSIPEMVIANVYMLIGLVIFGILVGTISNVTVSASVESTQWHNIRKKIDKMIEWLTEHKVDPGTKKKIRTYLTELWESQDEFMAEGEVFSNLPPNLHQSLAHHTMYEVVPLIKLFRSQEDGFKQLLAQCLRPVDAAPGHTLCQQGDWGDRLWVLVEGTLEASQYLGMRITLQADPEHPCLVGDSILLAHDAPAFQYRCFTLRAELHSGVLQHVSRQLWELRMSALQQILTMYPHLHTDMLNHVRDRVMLEVGLGVALTSGGEDFSSWSEAAACISNALLKQAPDVVDVAMDDLTQASIEDGSLQQLLDSLLEYSTATGSPHRQFPLPSHRSSAPSQATMSCRMHPGSEISESPMSGMSAMSAMSTMSFASRPSEIHNHSHSVSSSQMADKKFVWKPSRFGRQTLMRSSAASQGLGTTSIPVQDFGTGYTTHG